MSTGWPVNGNSTRSRPCPPSRRPWEIYRSRKCPDVRDTFTVEAVSTDHDADLEGLLCGHLVTPSSSVLVTATLEAHTSDVAARRDEENVMHACMALPPNLHRVHAPEDNHAAAVRAAQQTGRNRWRRVFGWRRRLPNP
jgi:hypothetical protein